MARNGVRATGRPSGCPSARHATEHQPADEDQQQYGECRDNEGEHARAADEPGAPGLYLFRALLQLPGLSQLAPEAFVVLPLHAESLFLALQGIGLPLQLQLLPVANFLEQRDHFRGVVGIHEAQRR